VPSLFIEKRLRTSDSRHKGNMSRKNLA